MAGEESAGELHVPLLPADAEASHKKHARILSVVVFSGSEARAIAPLVTVVNSTNTRQSDYFGRGSRPGPDIAWFRGILVQRKVAAIDVVVRNVLGQ